MEIKKLCLGGAASRGLCYVGALQHLYEKGFIDNVEIIAGVSIGALIGVCYIIGFKPNEMFEMLLYKDTGDFKDISLDFVLNKGSILRGDKYKAWIWELLSKKVDPMITFAQIHEKFKKKILMTATCIEDGLTIFSTDNTPHMPIFYAVMATMAIPFIFPRVEYKGKSYVDGGVLDNFPLHLLGDDAVGLRVTSKDLNMDYSSVFVYVAKLFQIISNQMRIMYGGGGQVIVIEAQDYNFVDFDFNIDDKLTLYYRGYHGITEFIENKIDEYTIKQIINELIKLVVYNTP